MSTVSASTYGTFKSSRAGKYLTMQRRAVRRIKYGDSVSPSLSSTRTTVTRSRPSSNLSAAVGVRYGY